MPLLTLTNSTTSGLSEKLAPTVHYGSRYLGEMNLAGRHAGHASDSDFGTVRETDYGRTAGSGLRRLGCAIAVEVQAVVAVPTLNQIVAAIRAIDKLEDIVAATTHHGGVGGTGDEVVIVRATH